MLAITVAQQACGQLAGQLTLRRILGVDLHGAEVHHARGILVAADDIDQVLEAGGMVSLDVDRHLANFLFALEFAAGLQDEALQRRFQPSAGEVDVPPFKPGRDSLRRQIEPVETAAAVVEVDGLVLRADLVDFADCRILLQTVAYRIGKTPQLAVAVAVGPVQRVARVRRPASLPDRPGCGR